LSALETKIVITAAGLARGDDVLSALRAAKSYVHRALRGAAGWRLGAGHGPLSWEAHR